MLTTGSRRHADHVTNAPQFTRATLIKLLRHRTDYLAVDVLQACGARVHLAHPLGVKGFRYRRVKNDVRDAPLSPSGADQRPAPVTKPSGDH